MLKTKRELLHAIASKIGGERGERMRTALKKVSPFDDLKDRPMSDNAFDAELKKLETDGAKAFQKKKKADSDEPGTWGLPN